MKQNVGKTDKLIRMLLGFVIVALGIYYESWWGLVGVVPLVTAFIGVCPVYRLFGVNTCKTNIKVN